MSACFAASAARLAGIAGAVLGWRPADFWAATPAELAAIVAALTGDAGAAPPAPDEIARLRKAFPDG